MNIRTRLLISSFVIFSVCFWVLSDWILKYVKTSYIESLEESLNDSANILSSLVENKIKSISTTNNFVLKEEDLYFLKQSIQSTQINNLLEMPVYLRP